MLGPTPLGRLGEACHTRQAPSTRRVAGRRGTMRRCPPGRAARVASGSRRGRPSWRRAAGRGRAVRPVTSSMVGPMRRERPELRPVQPEPRMTFSPSMSRARRRDAGEGRTEPVAVLGHVPSRVREVTPEGDGLDAELVAHGHFGLVHERRASGSAPASTRSAAPRGHVVAHRSTLRRDGAESPAASRPRTSVTATGAAGDGRRRRRT